MKKLLIKAPLVLALALAPSLVSCDDEKSTPSNPDAPTLTRGAFILNEGIGTPAEGSLDIIDFDNATIDNDVFAAANGRSIGENPQCGICYGSKIYVGLAGSKAIEIIDRATYKSIARINLADSESGSQPRSMVAQKGQVYIAMYDGFVCRLDTVAQQIKESIYVGRCPETMAIRGTELYVPKSGGEEYKENPESSATVISLLNFTVLRHLDNLPLNPVRILTSGNKLFLLAKGDDTTVKPRLYEMSELGETKPLAKATLACADSHDIYFVYAPTSYIPEEGDTPDDRDLVCRYSKYNVASGKTTGWGIARVDYPSAVEVDPISGKFLVASYAKSGLNPDYNAAGYVNEYNSDYSLAKTYSIGLGRPSIFFIND